MSKTSKMTNTFFPLYFVDNVGVLFFPQVNCSSMPFLTTKTYKKHDGKNTSPRKRKDLKNRRKILSSKKFQINAVKTSQEKCKKSKNPKTEKTCKNMKNCTCILFAPLLLNSGPPRCFPNTSPLGQSLGRVMLAHVGTREVSSKATGPPLPGWAGVPSRLPSSTTDIMFLKKGLPGASLLRS